MIDGELILYEVEDGEHVQLGASGGAVWLTQVNIAELSGTPLQSLQQTMARVPTDGEADESTINSELIVRAEGTRQGRREMMAYSLDMVRAAVYRSTSTRAMKFRQ
jgi:hypothetical protein